MAHLGVENLVEAADTARKTLEVEWIDIVAAISLLVVRPEKPPQWRFEV